MNIFVTDLDPKIAARNLCDKHVSKMLLESTQLLSNAVRLYHPDAETAPYKFTQATHPCSKWVTEARENFDWLLEHAYEINREFTARFDNTHKCHDALVHISNVKRYLNYPQKEMTAFKHVMPKIYRTENIVNSYRSYIIDAKTFAKWEKARSAPEWYYTHVVEYNHQEIEEYVKQGFKLPDRYGLRYLSEPKAVISAIFP